MDHLIYLTFINIKAKNLNLIIQVYKDPIICLVKRRTNWYVLL